MSGFDKDRVASILNNILEQELAGVVRYTHYSFLVFGHGRIPIVSWLRGQADESLLHAHKAGEMITHLGAYPSLGIGPLLDSHQLNVDVILREALASESRALDLYRSLLDAVTGKSVMLEEYARQMIYAEELHAGEVEKMLRRPSSGGNAPGARRLDEGQIERALLDPSTVFACPRDVVASSGISDAQKIEMLRRWEYDVREEEVAQEENMAGDMPVTLSHVLDALNQLGAHPGHDHPSPAKQGGQ